MYSKYITKMSSDSQEHGTPDEINEHFIIGLFLIIDVLGLIGICIYYNKLDELKEGKIENGESKN